MNAFKDFSLLFIPVIGLLVFDTASCLDIAEDVSNHKNIGLLKDNCGYPEKDRTLNASPLFEYHWLALIAYEGGKNISFNCQGALISDRYVLASAHCLGSLSGKLKPVSVRLGDYDLNSDKDCQESVPHDPKGTACAPAPIDINIEEIIIHPNYTGRRPVNVENDIAMLRLASPVVSDFVSPMCLPIGEQPKTAVEKYNLIGWDRNFKEQSIPVKLQVPVIGYDQCKAALKDQVGISDENNICVGGRNEANPFCPLSGSTLSSYIEKGNGGQGVYMMVAIGSVGSRTCTTDVIPEVFTRVGPHMKWILDTMKP